jgi:heme exporter protein D
MNELLYMGGYAAYVWTAYGLTAAVLIGMLAHSLLWHRRLLKDLRRRSARSGIGTAAGGKAPPHGVATGGRPYGTGSGAPTRGEGRRESGAP